MSETDDQYTCQKCGGVNRITVKDRMEAWGSLIETECETTCSKCGHSNYWAYGYYYQRYEAEKMDDTWINWRFGVRHLQIGKWFKFIRFSVNPYYIENPPETWFERY